MEALETKQPLGSWRDRGCSGAQKVLVVVKFLFLMSNLKKVTCLPLKQLEFDNPTQHQRRISAPGNYPQVPSSSSL